MNNYINAIRLIRPDVIHGYMPMQNLLVLLSKIFLPKTKVVWGLSGSSIGFGRISPSVRVIFKLTCWLSHKAHLIISNSEAGKQFHVSKGYPANLIEVIPNGIDTEYFQHQEAGRQLLRQQWGISNGEILIGNIGRLDRIKDHPTFLQACVKLSQKYPNLKFVCVGEDSVEYRMELELLARELMLQDRLIWAGERGDITSIYSALDLEVSSSLSEGLPNVVLEAMSCRIPIVATDVGDVKLVLEGIGICVPISNPVALAEAMDNMLQRDLSAIGYKGRQRIVENYSVDKLINRTEIHLKSLLEKERASSPICNY